MGTRAAGRIIGVLTRLRRNVAGNTLAIAAAAMLPLLGMVGGALDLSRLYMTKVRLQHACDAGALAGRKDMGGGSWDASAQASALQYFWGNFTAGAYGSGTTTPTFTSSGSNVQGSVTTSVPMTVMQVFKFGPKTLTVTCETAMQLPNTDVMFVLDVTGSMACLPSESSCGGNVRTGSKINVLKNAVKCFYEAHAQAKTDGTGCATNSYQGINSGSQLRFGFVPYSTNVDISQLNLPASYFAANWTYQSRSKTTDWTDWANTSNSCNNKPANTTTTKYQTVTSGNSCVVQSSTYTTAWLYAKTTFPMNVSAALSSFASATVPNPPTAVNITMKGIGSNYADRQVLWDGCVEEAAPTSNINQVPDPSKPATLYAPSLPDALYLRRSTAADSGDPDNASLTTATSVYTGNYYNGMRNYRYFCPTPAEKLQTTSVWTPTTFDSYVNTLTPVGNTYHDIGMLWGGRLISPEGMFASENKTTTQGGVIQRHVIFMTDGDPQAGGCDYTAYGVAFWDMRTGDTPSDACTTARDGTLTAAVTTRLKALCTSVKNEPNTLLWVISFGGTGIATSTKNDLKACASDSDHFFDATDATALSSAFQTIASRIAQLRLEE
ncbi:TadE/TadG family type IV pilus assembly protein [Sphingomonas sp. GC_Shp_1]|uniref:TadE/TadG family type IV pilus assembly protein n=1 Tax=unclassified Sphingomonas TaxID=196159 RepID=UPI00226ADFA6